MTINQQGALDEALVLHASRLRIGKSNFRLRSDIASKESTLQLVYDVLRLTPFYKAFLVTADTFDEIPFEEEIMAFLRYLGHRGDIKKITDVNIYKLHQPWRSFAAVINKCLSGKSKGYDSLRGPGVDEGTGILPGVPDVPTDESDEEISWKSSDEDDDADDDDQKDDNQEKVDDDQDTNNDGDDFEHPKLSIHEEEAKDEERFDPINVEDDDEELYRDVHINLEGQHVQMIDVHTIQEFENTHVTLTPVDVQASTIVAPLTLIAPTLPPPTIPTISQFVRAVSSIPGIVERYMDQRMNEAINKGISTKLWWMLMNVTRSFWTLIEIQLSLRDVAMMRIKMMNPSLDQTRGPREEEKEKSQKEPMQITQDLEEPSHQEFETCVTDDQPITEASQHPEWFQKQKKPPTPDRAWNKTLPTTHESIQPWISDLAKQVDSRSSFNELMETPVDFLAFLMNRLKVDTLTPELLPGPTYELTKGSSKSLVELEFFLEEVYKATTDQLNWNNPEGQQYPHNLLKPLPLIPNSRGRHVIPFDHFINNDLEYLRSDDDKLYKFKEGDFKRLYIQEFEDMLLLLVQGKLTNLTVKERFTFNISLRMFTRSIVIQRRLEYLQLGVKSYQKKLNLTKPDTYRFDLKRKEAYTAYSILSRFIYQNKDEQNRLMRIDELHKFSDGTLNDFRTALDDRLEEHSSDTSVFTMKMEVLLKPTSNKLMVGYEWMIDDGFLKWSILTDSQVTPTKHGRMTKPNSSHHFIASCFNAGHLKMEVKPNFGRLTTTIMAATPSNATTDPPTPTRRYLHIRHLYPEPPSPLRQPYASRPTLPSLWLSRATSPSRHHHLNHHTSGSFLPMRSLERWRIVLLCSGVKFELLDDRLAKDVPMVCLECSSCGALYTMDYCCSDGSPGDKIICDLDKTPDLSQRTPQNCPKCGNPVDGHYCQGCALLRKKFKEDMFTYCIENGILPDSSEPSNDNTNVVNALQGPFVDKQDPGKNSSQSPSQINHYCCYGCGDPLEDIFCHKCTCELCGRGTHYGYNCPPKVPVVPDPRPCNNQNVDELLQTVPSFDPTCYSKDGNSFNYDSTSNLDHDSPNDRPIVCYNDDDEDYAIAVTPSLSTEEPENSLSIWDEHLDTVSATDSDEFIKSSVESLVLIPSESEGIPDKMCDVPFHDNSPPLNISKDQFEDFSDSNDESTSIDDDSFIIDNIEYIEASPLNSELVSSEVMEIVILEVGGINDDILLTIKDDILREKLLKINLLIANIEALNDNPAPSFDFMTKSFSTSLNSLLEETNTFDNSLPEFEIFCFDLEEISCSSTTTRFDIFLPEYEAFYDDHVKEISSGNTTTHSDSSLIDSFIFDLLINPFPPADRSDFYEFLDELTHIISLPEYDCFCFKNEPNSGDFTMDVVEGIFPTRKLRVHDALPTHPPFQLNLDFILFSESLFDYVIWIFLPFLSYSVAPQYIISFENEDTILDLYISSYHISSFMSDVSHRSGTFMKINVHLKHVNESPMEILFSTCSPIDQ
nr:hypothetical protein [Tanacetum cinerariifolium]